MVLVKLEWFEQGTDPCDEGRALLLEEVYSHVLGLVDEQAELNFVLLWQLVKELLDFAIVIFCVVFQVFLALGVQS